MGTEQRRVYENGLVVIVEPLKVKKAAICVAINAGYKNEPKDKAGCAHVLEHTLFISNEFGYDSAEELELSGIDIGATTGKHNTRLSFNFLPKKLSLVVEKAHKIVSATNYDAKEFALEKESIRSENISDASDLDQIISEEVIIKELTKGTPLEGKSSKDQLEALKHTTLENVVEFKNKWYVPNNLVVVATGKVNPDQVFEEVGDTFGTMERTPVNRPDFSIQLKPGVEYVELKDLKGQIKKHDQAYVTLVYSVNGHQHKDSIALHFLEHTLSVGVTSLLYRNLRRKRGISYTPETWYTSAKEGSFMLLCLPNIPPTQIDAAVEGLEETIEETKQLLSADFLSGRKNLFKSHYLETIGDPHSNAIKWTEHELETPCYDFRGLHKDVKALTRRDVADVAQQNFQDPLIIIATAPKYKNKYNTRKTISV